MVPPLLERNHEHEVSTRDRLAGTGADARIEESVAMGEVYLALRPYGRPLIVVISSIHLTILRHGVALHHLLEICFVSSEDYAVSRFFHGCGAHPIIRR